MRLAVVHEWVNSRAGSEKTFEQLALTFPEAELYALTREPSVELNLPPGREIRTTFLDRAAVLRRRRNLTLPAMPVAWLTVGAPRDYDVVLTSSHAFARWFRPARDALHLSYCYSPMRYAWQPELDNRLPRMPQLAKVGSRAMQLVDRRSVAWTDGFAAISTAVAKRIEDFYGRESRVIFPPVDLDFFTPEPRERTHLLAVSRFIPYKRLDLAIRVAQRVGMPIVIAGSGPEEANLRAVADETPGLVEFEIAPSDERLRELYRSALALLFFAEEDFGIVPVEAQACGTPVVALGVGGSIDTVSPSTGVLVDAQTTESFTDGLRRLLDAPPAPETCAAHARRFRTERFRDEIRQWVAEETASRRS